MNYKSVLLNLINNTKAEALSFIVENESLPFEICQLILNRKDVGDGVRLAMVSRRDCPIDSQIKFCLNETSNLVDVFLRRRVEHDDKSDNLILPDEVADAIISRGELLPIMCSHPLISSEKKLQLVRKVIAMPNSMKNMANFLQSNWFLEDDCIAEIDNWISGNMAYEYGADNAYFNCCCRNLLLLRSPINEKLCLSIIEKFVEERREMPFSDDDEIYKIACNKSITDYVVMALIMQCEEYVESIGEIIKCREPDRCNYRKLNNQ